MPYMSDTQRVEAALPGRCLHFIAAHLEATYGKYARDIEAGRTQIRVRAPRPGEDPEELRQAALAFCHRQQDGYAEIAGNFAQSWTAVLRGETQQKMQKVFARMHRALLVVLPPDLNSTSLASLVRVHWLVQELVDRDLWVPDQAYLTAFDRLSDMIQADEGVAQDIGVIEKAAQKAAPKMLGKLQELGYYRRVAVAAGTEIELVT